MVKKHPMPARKSAGDKRKAAAKKRAPKGPATRKSTGGAKRPAARRPAAPGSRKSAGKTGATKGVRTPSAKPKAATKSRPAVKPVKPVPPAKPDKLSKGILAATGKA